MLRACLKIVAADVRRRKIVRLLARNPPSYVGGYSISVILRHTLKICGYDLELVPLERVKAESREWFAATLALERK